MYTITDGVLTTTAFVNVLVAAPVAVNYWIAPPLQQGQTAASWDLDTNWSLGTHPNQGQDIEFNAQKSDTPCNIPANDPIANLNSLTFGDWAGTLTVNAGTTVTASTVTVSARKNLNPGDEIILNAGSQIHASQTLNLLGGKVSGQGTLQAEGTVTVNNTNANDPVTLAAPLSVGTANGAVRSFMTTAQTSQPLKVQGNGQITINNNSVLDFLNQPPQGQNAVTAITNADNAQHSIYVLSGGSISYASTNYEVYVGMGVYLWDGKIAVTNPANNPRNVAPPLHFTGSNPAGGGLFIRGSGEVDVLFSASLSFDGAAEINDNGTVTTYGGSLLTLGVAANSPAGVMYDGTINMYGGKIISHGGFYMLGGTLACQRNASTTIQVDAGTAFNFEGGTITTGQVQGQVNGVINFVGDFVGSGGSIIVMADTTGGKLRTGHIHVTGNVQIINRGVTFTSGDVNANPGNVNRNWNLFDFTGALTGDFTYSLPNGWTNNWDPVAKQLLIHEP
jgi:hypothetical protein